MTATAEAAPARSAGLTEAEAERRLRARGPLPKPPTSAGSEGPDGQRPPLQVVCHGGPTAHSAPSLSLGYQFFTQRGIGVVDVNYRGSSGFGREYRRLLNGRWGEIDWQDCVAAARYLAAEGETDAERTWVEGGHGDAPLRGHPRDWLDKTQGEGQEFLREATQVKNIWTPYGE